MRKRNKSRNLVFGKLDIEKVRSLGVNKLPNYDYSWRRGAETNKIPSLHTKTAFVPARISMTDPMTLSKESKETQDAIIAKSKRIAIAYNKGAYQYVTEETDPASLGSGERLRR